MANLTHPQPVLHKRGDPAQAYHQEHTGNKKNNIQTDFQHHTDLALASNIHHCKQNNIQNLQLKMVENSEGERTPKTRKKILTLSVFASPVMHCCQSRCSEFSFLLFLRSNSPLLPPSHRNNHHGESKFLAYHHRGMTVHTAGKVSLFCFISFLES